MSSKLFERVLTEAYSDDLAAFQSSMEGKRSAYSNRWADRERYEKDEANLLEEVKEFFAGKGLRVTNLKRPNGYNGKDFIVEFDTGLKLKGDEDLNLKLLVAEDREKFSIVHSGQHSSFDFNKCPPRTKASLFNMIADLEDFFEERGIDAVKTKIMKEIQKPDEEGWDRAVDQAHKNLSAARSSYEKEFGFQEGKEVRWTNAKGDTSTAVIEKLNIPENWAMITTRAGRRMKVNLSALDLGDEYPDEIKNDRLYDYGDDDD